MKPLIDHYGTQLTVEVVGHSAGYMVDIDRAERGFDPNFDSLTPEQARELAAHLIAAADQIEGAVR